MCYLESFGVVEYILGFFLQIEDLMEGFLQLQWDSIPARESHIPCGSWGVCSLYLLPRPQCDILRYVLMINIYPLTDAKKWDFYRFE